MNQNQNQDRSNTAPNAEAQNLCLSYGKQGVLKNLNWKLMPGQVVGLLGRNGAGKTTLLETLLGLREPQSGQVELFGAPASKLSDENRARIGYVPQRSDLFEGFTAQQLLDYFKSFYPRWNTSKVEGLMSRWGVPAHQSIALMSGGQQQRLSIIRALAHDPDLLVLDEPVASLDPAGRRDFLRELVDQVLDRGTTVVLSTHILSDLERVAFNVAFMREGQIGIQSPLDELLDQTRQVSGSSEQVHMFAERSKAQILKMRSLSAGRSVAMLKIANPQAQDGAGLVIERTNLEELFMELA